jgi:hypothetical protein
MGPKVELVFTQQRLLVETGPGAGTASERRSGATAAAAPRTPEPAAAPALHAPPRREPHTVVATLRAALNGYADHMSEQQSGAGDTAREMREHEREAREREPEERDTATAGAGDPDVASEPAPPGNVQTGEVSGGS